MRRTENPGEGNDAPEKDEASVSNATELKQDEAGQRRLLLRTVRRQGGEVRRCFFLVLGGERLLPFS